MVKLIVTDMDGTLLDSQDNINPEFFEVFNKLQEKDVIFAAASGRQYYNLLNRFDSIKDNMMFIAENGTFVAHNGIELQVNALERKVAMSLVKIARTIENSYVIICGKNSAYVESTDEKFMEQVNKYYKKVQVVEDVTTIKDDILKVTICDFNGSEGNSYTYFKDFEDVVQVAVSGEIWLDMMAKGINKGVAIEKLQTELNISPKETMVFGDYLNDLEMMKCAEHSYAMENAHEELKKVARFTTKSNDDNGVVHAIKEKFNF